MKTDSICAWCSRMKRGVLYATMQAHGYNVLVLGQHLDDLVRVRTVGKKGDAKGCFADVCAPTVQAPLPPPPQPTQPWRIPAGQVGVRRA
jgi:hypothetical protein